MRFFKRRLPPIPEPRGAPTYVRRQIDWSFRSGWEPAIQRVRLNLPDHLHDSPPYPNGGRGLWAVVAEVDGVPVGLAWSIEAAADRRAALVEELAVVANWQRRGIGRHLILESAAWMAEKGYERLAALPVSPEAHRLLARLGFADEGYRTQLVDIAELLAQ